MFYGYSSLSDMQASLPLEIVNELVLIAKKKQLTVCSKDKICVGGWDGDFYYLDKSKDRGRIINSYTAKIGDDIYAWSDN